MHLYVVLVFVVVVVDIAVAVVVVDIAVAVAVECTSPGQGRHQPYHAPLRLNDTNISPCELIIFRCSCVIRLLPHAGRIGDKKRKAQGGGLISLFSYFQPKRGLQEGVS